jgi:TPR repeat protein
MHHVVLTVIVAVAQLAAPAGPAADRELTRALAEVRERAAKGDVVAQFSLGSILYYGADDTAQAIEWFRKAAAQQYPPAEFQVGQLYDFGFGVAQSDGEALSWYRRAAGHGHAAAERAIGDFYQKGRGVTADATEASRWYRRAADADDIRAQYQLGQLYFEGTGVPRDYVAAYLWFSLAATQAPLVDNRKGLLELRNIAAARLTPAQAEEAARRVASWKPQRSR